MCECVRYEYATPFQQKNIQVLQEEIKQIRDNY